MKSTNQKFKGKSFKYYMDLTASQKEEMNILLDAAKRLYNNILVYREDDYEYAKENFTFQNEIRSSFPYYFEMRFIKEEYLKYCENRKFPPTFSEWLYPQSPKSWHFKYGHRVSGISAGRSDYDYYKELRDYESVEYPKGGIQNLPSSIVLGVIGRAERSFQNFFAGRASYPRKHDKENSLTYAQTGCKLKDGVLYIPKFGDCKLSYHRPIPIGGKIKSVIISRSNVGKYYVSIFVEYKVTTPERNNEIVGMDRNIKYDADSKVREFAVGWDGKHEHTLIMPAFWRIDQHDLARVQRKMAGLKKGSPEWRKSLRALQHIYERIENRKKDWLHNQSKKIVDGFGTVILEDLDIVDMTDKEKGKRKASKKKTPVEENDSLTRSKQVRRGFSEVSHSRFSNMLEQKFNEYGGEIILVPPQYTSMTCSTCGYINKNLKLSDREWACPECNVVHNRDLNAAKNIYKNGISIINART
jgi:putative transposase